MNKKVLALTKVFLKNSFQSFQSSNQEDLKKKKKSNGMKLLYLISFVYLAGIMGFMSYSMINGLMQINQETMFIGMFLLAIAGFLMFQSIFSCMNIFYFSKDIESVLPLPLKPKEILMAKFNVVLITEYVMEIILALIPFILYGILTGASILYYFAMVIILLVFPILPLVISSLLVVMIMSFAKFTTKKENFQFIATLFIIIIVFGIQFGVYRGEQISQEEMIANLVNSNSLVKQIQNYFITISPSIGAMNANHIGIMFIELIKVIAITLVSYILFLVVGQKLYLRGVVGNLSGNGKKNKKKINVETDYKQRNIGISYVKKELNILIRNPIFCMQCILPALLFPIIFLGFFFLGSGNVDISEFRQIFSSTYSSIIIFILIGITEFFSMFSYISITAISRDGQNANFTKYIPLSFEKQFRYKAIPNVILNIISDIIVFTIFYIVYPQTPIIFLVAILLILILIHIISSYLTLIIDLKKPKLEWNTEYAVVKQNMNLIFPAILGLVGIVICVFLGMIFSEVPPIITLIVLAIILSGIFAVLNIYIKKNQMKLFEKIN